MASTLGAALTMVVAVAAALATATVAAVLIATAADPCTPDTGPSRVCARQSP